MEDIEEIKALENRLKEAQEKLERKKREERIEFLKAAIQAVESELQVPSLLEVGDSEGNEALNNLKRPRLGDVSSGVVNVSTVSNVSPAGMHLDMDGEVQVLDAEACATRKRYI